MQFRHFFALLMCAAFILVASSAAAQKVTTNELGEKIVIYPDGSWKYFDELGEADREEVTQKLLEERTKELGKKKRKKDKKKKRGKKKKTEYTEAEEGKARLEAIQMADWTAGQEQAAKEKEEDATFNRIFLEDELSDAYQNTTMTTADIDRLEVKLKAARLVEKEAKERYKMAKKDAKIAEKMIDMDKSSRDKFLAKIEEKKMKERIKEGQLLQEETAKLDAEDKDVSNDNEWLSDGRKNKLRKYNPDEDVMVNPPAPPCEFTYDDVDEFTGKRRRDLVKRPFFVHTSDRLKPYFKERDHITGEGFISASSGGVKYLNLQITILSEQAQREFGVLEKGSILSVKLLNGAAVKLLNTKTSTGTVSKLNKTTIYRGQYLISSDQEKQIKKNEVDKVRVVWSTGYEDYEVYELDFFLDQFKCLED